MVILQSDNSLKYLVILKNKEYRRFIMNQKEPKFYENLLNQEKPLTEDEVEDHLAEVSSILLGLEKGLKMLKDMNRKPDPKVLENQERFDEIKRRLLALVK
jgi:hypothetical protein